MKYLETGGFQDHPLMRLTLQLTLLFMAGLWFTNLAMYFSRMGLAPASVTAYYLGSEEEFRAARSAASMLEVTHAHLPVMGVVVLLMTHLFLFAPYRDSTKIAAISAAFASALLSEGSGWLVRFIDPRFAWLKIASFLVFQCVLGLLIVGLAAFLLRPGRQPRTGQGPPRGRRALCG